MAKSRCNNNIWLIFAQCKQPDFDTHQKANSKKHAVAPIILPNLVVVVGEWINEIFFPKRKKRSLIETSRMKKEYEATNHSNETRASFFWSRVLNFNDPPSAAKTG